MADRNEKNQDDRSNKNDATRREEDEDENENGEHSGLHFRGNIPDIGLGDNFSSSNQDSRNGPQQRKDDGPISFRHFLESSARSQRPTTSYPDLYVCSQPNIRSNPITSRPESFSPLVDSASAPVVSSSNNVSPPRSNNVPSSSVSLPDFVQDQLIAEQYANNQDSSFSSSHGASNLPDFTENNVPLIDEINRLKENRRFIEDAISNLTAAYSCQRCFPSSTSQEGASSSSAPARNERQSGERPVTDPKLPVFYFEKFECGTSNAEEQPREVSVPSTSGSAGPSRLPDFVEDSNLPDSSSRQRCPDDVESIRSGAGHIRLNDSSPPRDGTSSSLRSRNTHFGTDTRPCRQQRCPTCGRKLTGAGDDRADKDRQIECLQNELERTKNVLDRYIVHQHSAPVGRGHSGISSSEGSGNSMLSGPSTSDGRVASDPRYSSLLANEVKRLVRHISDLITQLHSSTSNLNVVSDRLRAVTEQQNSSSHSGFPEDSSDDD